QLSDSVAKLPNNKSKNRYANIYSCMWKIWINVVFLTDDHSRVKLQTDGNESDYINAGYIDSYEGARTFIASQGPKSDTVKDFWKMIWETNSKVIVMLTNLMENGKAKCEQYWPEPGCTLRCGSFEIQLREENEKDSYITRTLLVANEDADYKPRSISQLHFTTWPDHGVPSSTTGFLRFYHHVKEVMETVSGAPVTVHCSAGVGRTGTLIGFDILMAEMKKHKSVNVLETVVNMRKDRTLMVQTLEQYIFLHKLLVEVHLFGSTDFKATEINQKIEEMKRCRNKHGMNGFQVEFQNLELIGPIDVANEIAAQSCNAKFNRFPGILPYDHSRVKVQIDGNESDYINAGYIDSYEGARTFIASQGPKPDTVKDFWKMIWETNSKVIVMLTNLMEKNKVRLIQAVAKYKQHNVCTLQLMKKANMVCWFKIMAKCEQYWPEPGCTLRCGSFEIQLREENEKDSYITRTFIVSQSNQSHKPRSISQLHFTTWPDHGVPSSTTGFLRFYHHVKEVMETVSGTPVTVHCSDGAGRTGVLISVANLVERIKSENKLDVFRTVKDLRDMRPKMVTSEAQYRFIYEVCRKFVEGFATYDNFK
uniref:Tyrosine-protein phosphatase non-receptor type 20 n=1 Tax=Ciona savignyi TaxID=51511 RepID=H2ZAR0_CIOSA